MRQACEVEKLLQLVPFSTNALRRVELELQYKYTQRERERERAIRLKGPFLQV